MKFEYIQIHRIELWAKWTEYTLWWPICVRSFVLNPLTQFISSHGQLVDVCVYVRNVQHMQHLWPIYRFDLFVCSTCKWILRLNYFNFGHSVPLNIYTKWTKSWRGEITTANKKPNEFCESKRVRTNPLRLERRIQKPQTTVIPLCTTSDISLCRAATRATESFSSRSFFPIRLYSIFI